MRQLLGLLQAAVDLLAGVIANIRRVVLDNELKRDYQRLLHQNARRDNGAVINQAFIDPLTGHFKRRRKITVVRLNSPR